ncbi:MAG TPA: YihY/virulence factor BrkB family protein [Polyangiaceae bacterium]|jgi:membrane protein|nr:YihY/virulence factor BrkB family protein [Polyangiaceae bacterium]
MTRARVHPAALTRVLVELRAEARSVLSSFVRRNALVDAGAMAFALFLASIPLMGLAGAVIAHVLRGEPRALSILSSLVDVAPDEVRELADRYIARGSDQGLAPVFLFGSLWLAAGAFHDAMTVFESALDASPRTWVQKRLISMACVVALLTLLAVLGSSLVVFLGGPVVLLAALLERGLPRTAGILVPALAAVGTLLPLAAFFRVAVRHRSRTPVIWRGAITTVAIGSVASYGFARYARSLARYAVFYGGLAAVAVFMVWLWLCCIALLLGVETNAEAERQRHSLAPPPPNGRRGR